MRISIPRQRLNVNSGNHTIHMAGLAKDYETQKHTIRFIESLYGLRTAVEVEGSFRSGATIRALEELKAISSPKDKEGIPGSAQ
jgi:hypothetical protein